MRARVQQIAVILLVACAVPHAAFSATESQNRSNRGAYVGSRVCFGCHSEIYGSYKKTGMGNSMSLVNAVNAPVDPGVPVTIQSQKLSRWFTISRDERGISQSEFQLDSKGREIFRDTHLLVYAIGSGRAGRTYLVRRGKCLFEAPLSFYSGPGQWDLSPGYESSDTAFSRRVNDDCLTCHTGRVQLVLGSDNKSNEENDPDLSVACENCHGPGEQHVNERSGGIPVPESGDASIVNPGRLAPWLADNICIDCHEAGAARVLQPGKSFGDFRPAQVLDETVAIFALRANPESSRSSPLQHYTSMLASKCYRGSGGKLSCLSCHDPHAEPASPVSYFRQKCLVCHADADCRLSSTVRNARNPQNDCAGCHMPKRELREISHSALTDHRIVIRSDEPYPTGVIEQSRRVFGSIVHVNGVPGQPDHVSALTLLEAYSALLTSNPSLQREYDVALDRAAVANPDSASVLSKLGWRSYSQNTPEARALAISYFKAAIAHGCNSAADYGALGDLLLNSGQTEDALRVLQNGITLDPYYQRSYKLLALCYIALGRYREALGAMQQGLEVLPEDSSLRDLLSRAQLPK